MPYRRKGRKVQVKKRGRWRTLYTHKTAAKAERQRRAIYANVKRKHK